MTGPASEKGQTQIDDRVVQLAAFRVGEDDYAIDIMRIREIINPLRITPVPDAAGLIEGVINLRGVIIPIVDMRKRFGLPTQEQTRLTKFIITAVRGRLVGFRVDEMLDVVRLPMGQIKAAPRLGEGREPGLIVGVCQHHDRLLLLLNLNRVVGQEFFLADEDWDSAPGAKA